MKLKLYSSLVLIFVLAGISLDIPLKVASSRVVFDDENRLISIELADDDRFRYFHQISDFDPLFVKQIRNKEDRFFDWHFGVNPISFVRASAYYFFGKKNRGGASTITMQLARLYFGLDTRTPIGKLNQVFHALWLELIMSKDSILQAYLNLIPMGRNIEGYETGALYYFRKEGKYLNQHQRNFLSLLPQKPYLLEEFQKKNFKAWEESWAILYPGLNSDEALELLKKIQIHDTRPFQAPHYSYQLQKRSSNKRLNGTINSALQSKVEEIVARYINSMKSKGIENASVLILDSETKEIKTYIGSADFYNSQIQGQVDGIMSERSPGSTLKPFIYAKAFETGLVIPKSIVYDSPLPYRTPENFDRYFKGPMTVEEALITSRNVPAVWINNELQARKEGLYGLINPVYPVSNDRGYYGSSIALGALEMNSLQLGELYMALANNGEFSKARWFKEENSSTINILSEEASVLVKDILRRNPRPQFEKSQAFSDQIGEVYWKTGTSFGFRDAWAVGIWNKYVIVTWLGDFKSLSNPYLVGSISAGPLFFKVIDYLRSEQNSLKDFDLNHLYHKNVSEVDVCPVSGKLPNEDCPATIKSLYISGVSSIEKCKLHQKIQLSKENQLRVCPAYHGETIEKVFEVFSSAKAEVYEQYGLKLKRPPEFEKICRDKVVFTKEHRKPIIISPKLGMIYISEQEEGAIVPLEGRIDSVAVGLSWYLNERLIAQTKMGETKTVLLRKGHHSLKVVDSLGRVSERSVQVK